MKKSIFLLLGVTIASISSQSLLIFNSFVAKDRSNNNVDEVLPATDRNTNYNFNYNFGISDKYINTDLGKFILELQAFLSKFSNNYDIETAKIEISKKLYELANKFDSAGVYHVINELYGVLSGKYSNSSSLLSSLGTKLTSFIGNIGSLLNISDNSVTASIKSTTASKEAGKNFEVDLKAHIYYASTKDGKKSTKWAVLLHGYMMNGKLMKMAVGDMYLKQGYNVLAIDSRGFGESGGSVAMGYLESLDAWDWLNYINSDKVGAAKASKVIVHGVSLGGATSLQLWTQKGFGRDLTKMNVIGIVDDCGYDSMTGIIQGMVSSTDGLGLLNAINSTAGANKSTKITGKEVIKTLLLKLIGTGLTESNFDEKQDAFYKTRKMSNVPLYIIHGDADTTVPYSISKNIVSVKAKDAGLLYKFWTVSGKPHAFIVVGMDKANYEKNLVQFITDVEKGITSGSNGGSTGGETEKPVGNNNLTSVVNKVFSFISSALKNVFK